MDCHGLMAWSWIWIWLLSQGQGGQGQDCQDEVFGDVFEVSLLQTSRHLSRVRALKPEPEEPEETSCSGSFRFCSDAERRVCAYIPGCNWHRESAYGGWCLENSKRGGARACAALDGPRCAAEPGCRWERSWPDAFCRGDGGRWQNPGCSFTNDAEACMAMPGCNWEGRSSYGGWCSGGSGDGECAFETTQTSCARHGCTWTMAA